MTTDEAQELTRRITAEKLWRVHELIILPGYPRDTRLRVKRRFYSPEVEYGAVQVEAVLLTTSDYEILRMLATTTPSAQGGSLQGMPS